MKFSIKPLKNKYVIFAICMVLAGLIAFVLVPNKQNHANDTIDIIQVKNRIEANTVIDESMLQSTKIMPINISKDVVTDMNQIVGKYATMPLLPDDILTPQKFSDTSSISTSNLFELNQDKLAVSVSVKSLAASVSGKIMPGDVVSIYNYDTEAKTLKEYPDLKYVQVLAITNDKADDIDRTASTDKSEGENSVIPSTITVLVDEQQAKELIECENKGNIHVVFAARGEYGKSLLNLLQNSADTPE